MIETFIVYHPSVLYMKGRGTGEKKKRFCKRHLGVSGAMLSDISGLDNRLLNFRVDA